MVQQTLFASWGRKEPPAPRDARASSSAQSSKQKKKGKSRAVDDDGDTQMDIAAEAAQETEATLKTQETAGTPESKSDKRDDDEPSQAISGWSESEEADTQQTQDATQDEPRDETQEGTPSQSRSRHFHPRSGHKKYKPYSKGPRSGGSGGGGRWKSNPLTSEEKNATMPFRKNNNLAQVAEETLSVLPDILDELPHLLAEKAIEFRLPDLAALDPSDNPRYIPPGGHAPRTSIRVVNADTFDAALALPKRIDRDDKAWTLLQSSPGPSAAAAAAHTPSPSPAKNPTSTSTSTALYGRPLILNFASNYVPGGGWLKGARAQEESLCYRSSLYLSLASRLKPSYPLRQLSALYSPDVVILRAAQDAGHALLPLPPRDLPVVSVLSVAALRRPPLRTVPGPDGSPREVFREAKDRELTKAKMRLTLRVAGSLGHGLVVLGALGCGAFRNPPGEVAECWAEVVREPEFGRGRFRELCFAVWDKRGEGNFEVFRDALDGLQL